MYVSRESAEQTQQRLLRVVAAASLRVHDGAFAYAEYPIDRFPAERARDALALEEHVGHGRRRGLWIERGAGRYL